MNAKELLISLRQDNLAKRRKKLKAALMFKILNGLAPDYLQDLFSIRTTKYNVRNLEMKLNLPKPDTAYFKKSFSCSAASLWNNLPNDLRTIESLRSFKREVNRFNRNEGRAPTRQPCMYVCMYVCACVRACVHACVHACMYACMYVCMYVCM